MLPYAEIDALAAERGLTTHHGGSYISLFRGKRRVGILEAPNHAGCDWTLRIFSVSPRKLMDTFPKMKQPAKGDNHAD